MTFYPIDFLIVVISQSPPKFNLFQHLFVIMFIICSSIIRIMFRITSSNSIQFFISSLSIPLFLSFACTSGIWHARLCASERWRTRPTCFWCRSNALIRVIRIAQLFSLFQDERISQRWISRSISTGCPSSRCATARKCWSTLIPSTTMTWINASIVWIASIATSFSLYYYCNCLTCCKSTFYSNDASWK